MVNAVVSVNSTRAFVKDLFSQHCSTVNSNDNYAANLFNFDCNYYYYYSVGP